LEEQEQEEDLFGDLITRKDIPEVGNSAIDAYLMSLSKKFMKYRLNIFLLNRVSINTFLLNSK
jgi:hypothetical protein